MKPEHEQHALLESRAKDARRDKALDDYLHIDAHWDFASGGDVMEKKFEGIFTKLDDGTSSSDHLYAKGWVALELSGFKRTDKAQQALYAETAERAFMRAALDQTVSRLHYSYRAKMSLVALPYIAGRLAPTETDDNYGLYGSIAEELLADVRMRSSYTMIKHRRGLLSELNTLMLFSRKNDNLITVSSFRHDQNAIPHEPRILHDAVLWDESHPSEPIQVKSSSRKFGRRATRAYDPRINNVTMDTILEGSGFSNGNELMYVMFTELKGMSLSEERLAQLNAIQEKIFNAVRTPKQARGVEAIIAIETDEDEQLDAHKSTFPMIEKWSDEPHFSTEEI